ncbi:MAG: DUF4384 domain-containing protein [Bryobacteraceae bacterium]|nr:DUF4384 domain-containing protein [Bryobacteraceae bacterium]
MQRLYSGVMALGVLMAANPQPLSTTRSAELLRRPPVVRKISVTVERQVNNKVERMDPSHVFARGELVRFRFQANFPGYLYVLNHSTSGRDVLLFPKEETGLDNRIDKDREYVMPMTESGWFRMEGPAGHEVTYWVVSPLKLTGKLGPLTSETPPPPASAMTPRCDDSIFKARGDCVDVTAGPQAVRSVPDSLSGLVGAKPRELTMTKSGDATTSVLVPKDVNEPLIYSFRLAHQ